MLETALKDVVVIIPAGGSGTRFTASLKTVVAEAHHDQEIPKQFAAVGNEKVPLLVHTLNSFGRISWISKLIVLVPDDWIQQAQAAITQHGNMGAVAKCQLAVGGATRHRTIQNGVKLLEHIEPKPEVVIVHDGVRPFANGAVCRSVADAAKTYGAAGVYAPLVSTIVQVNSEGFLDQALPRSQYFASEMPQAFTWPVLREAYKRVTEEELDTGTECLALAQKYATRSVKMIPVSGDRFFKVTYDKDLVGVDGIVDNLPVGLATGLKNSSSSSDFVVDARRASLCAQCAKSDGDFP